jgi:hypothetical protein
VPPYAAGWLDVFVSARLLQRGLALSGCHVCCMQIPRASAWVVAGELACVLSGYFPAPFCRFCAASVAVSPMLSTLVTLLQS